MFKVFITRRLPSIARKILTEKFSLSYSDQNRPLSRDKLKKVVSDYDAIICTVSEKLDLDILNNKDKLKVISKKSFIHISKINTTKK